MTEPPPAIAVVVVSYDSREWLPGLLTSLHAQTAPAAELVVVDNGSRDGTVAWLAAEHPHVRVLALSDNHGFAHAANRGIAATSAELVALVNPDVELAPDWLARMAPRFAADAGLGAATGKMVSLADPRVIYDAGDILRRDGACLQRGRRQFDRGQYDAPGEVFGACAGAALYRRTALASVGGLCEDYFLYLEDVELALALRVAGWRCAYEPALSRHAGEASGEPGSAHRWVARNTLLLVARWFPAAWLPAVAYRQLAALALARREHRLAAHLAALAAGLTLVPGAVCARRGLRRRSSVPIEQVIPPMPIRGPGALGHPGLSPSGDRLGPDPDPTTAHDAR